MHGFIDVTKRQLKDVLPGGKFSEEASLELRRSMTHCKLTNLISEHEFGDLDYSQYRRRHASLHFHSSIQMVKRNKTISVWLNSKSIQNQNTLLLKAREQGISLRKKHAEQEKHVIEKVTATLEATHRQKMEKEANHIELKRAIIESVQLYEGPCKSAADVNQLLNRLSGESETKKKEVLKQEIKYLKVVLGVKDSRLIFGKKVSVALAAGLKGVLSATDVADSMEVDLEVEHADCNVHAATGAPATGALVRGKKRKASTGETNPNKTFKPDHANSDAFIFDKQGVWVAVAYETEFFIGCVISVDNPLKGTIQFLNQGAQSQFRWPRVDDISDVEAKFVFAHDVDVQTQNGRVWSIVELEYLNELYQEYKELHFIVELEYLNELYQEYKELHFIVELEYLNELYQEYKELHFIVELEYLNELYQEYKELHFIENELVDIGKDL